jgi:hypothetical protein
MSSSCLTEERKAVAGEQHPIGKSDVFPQLGRKTATECADCNPIGSPRPEARAIAADRKASNIKAKVSNIKALPTRFARTPRRFGLHLQQNRDAEFPGRLGTHARREDAGRLYNSAERRIEGRLLARKCRQRQTTHHLLSA